MTCIKTGFQAFLVPYDQYLYGDAYLVGDCYIFRICEESEHSGWPITGLKIHFTICSYEHWFDSRPSSMEHNSTLIADADDVIDHGYDGVLIKT